MVHAWQSPPQAASQHTPSTQKPEAHCVAAVHAAPLPCGGTQAPPTHTLPETQCELAVQGFLHAPEAQAYGAHAVPMPFTQAPVPLQILGVERLPAHTLAPQPVPEAQSAQAPAPSQAPLVPQVEAAVAAHSSSGSAPAAMGPQVPSVPLPFLAAEQAWHVPPQATLQHTPSAQEPEAHCAPAVQAAPFESGGTQAVPTQTLLPAQSAEVAQLVLHAPEAQA
jgi:hypothetical protein